MTKAAITNSSSLSGNREYCDFFAYFGHGNNGGLYLGAGSAYGAVFPTELSMGTGYNKYALLYDCLAFNVPNPSAHWAPAFKGLRALLGFKSLMWDNYESWNLFLEFWTNWATRERSLLNSWFVANSKWGYQHLGGTGLEPGCLSAPVVTGTVDHCRLAFKWVPYNHDHAAYGGGYFYSRKIGSPIYQ